MPARACRGRRWPLTRRLRSAARWTRRSALTLALLAYAAGMVVLAGVLFHNGYAAAAAGTIAGGAGFLAGIAWSARRTSDRR